MEPGTQMPLSKKHKSQTRLKIVDAARALFNRHGFNAVSIDMVMAQAGLTRGGFYNHFSSKDELFSEAVRGFLTGRGAQWREDAGVDLDDLKPEMARQMIECYLSNEHLADLDGQCPMIALPSDVGRSNSQVQGAYQELLTAMVWLFERSLNSPGDNNRQTALSLASLCVGAMVLARSLPDSSLAADVREAARATADQMVAQ